MKPRDRKLNLNESAVLKSDNKTYSVIETFTLCTLLHILKPIAFNLCTLLHILKPIVFNLCTLLHILKPIAFNLCTLYSSQFML